MGRANHYRARIRFIRTGIFCLLLIALLWIVFVGGARPDETIVGAGVAVFSLGFLYQIWRTETLNIDLHTRDLAQGWRIPWDVSTDVCAIIAVLVKDLFGVKRAGSFYRVSGFKTRRSDPRFAARRVLATFYTTMSPNCIVIGIDYRRGRMLFHQLKRSSIPKIAQALGAKSEGPRP